MVTPAQLAERIRLIEENNVPVLDSGYVRMVEPWGSDERIIESARMSTGKSFLGWGTKESPGDEKLLRRLYRMKHTSPFEMAGATIEIQAPIAVFREWQRHRTQAYSEMSARFAPLPDMNYIPTVSRLMLNQGTTNKQAGKVEWGLELTEEAAMGWLTMLEEGYDFCERVYQEGLRIGVAKELARLIVPVGRYSRMRATANLHNWLRFLTLRLPEDAQWEIRSYGAIVAEQLSNHFPRTMALFGEQLLHWKVEADFKKFHAQKVLSILEAAHLETEDPAALQSFKDLCELE